ncbi:hypothetical protein TNCV_4720513 [Trichonephila clavipes]|uniref:Uncharacterized protein n=1 Tax=Trichonephila clavipes TaxID=2585209 RepID=A0A8X7BEK0_TRICX|nr:hypothetical protein TNCV_4720513 [Trichonephila clavipes]
MEISKDPSSVDSIYGSHVITGVIHPISGAVPVPVSNQRRHKNRKNGGHLHNSTKDKKKGRRQEASLNDSKNNSSAGIVRKNGSHQLSSSNRSRNNSSAGIDNKKDGRRQNFQNRSRNTSSTRKEDHVITGIIYPISGAVPVPVSSQRRHKNPHRRHRHRRRARNNSIPGMGLKRDL